jgi:hypothetical protein
LNNTMWRLSPLLAWRIHDHTMLQTPGEVGGEQSMVPGRKCPLPWAPDLVGVESSSAAGIIVVGSSYSPFIDGLAGRGARLALLGEETSGVLRPARP